MGESNTDEAPATIGPLSPGTVDGDRVFVSDQGPADPGAGEALVRLTTVGICGSDRGGGRPGGRPRLPPLSRPGVRVVSGRPAGVRLGA